MTEQPTMRLNAEGAVTEASNAAALLSGIPGDELKGCLLTKHIIPEHRIRFTCELEAIVEGSQRHGRIHCTVIGLDGIGRRLTLVMNQTTEEQIHVALLPYQHPESSLKAPGSSLLDPGRFLSVARRISGISRKAQKSEELLSGGLEVLVEVTSAASGAAFEWGERQKEKPLITIGPFNEYYLRGVFRPAILARLTRGDVVVKESSPGSEDSDTCLIIVPLLSSTALVGLILLSIGGHSVLVPEEQQTLSILGEMMGLGIKTLSTATRQEQGLAPHKGDIEAGVALGRLSSGLAHEINNAVTVLRGNLEQIMLRGDGHGQGVLESSAVKDSMKALDVICDLNDALRAFAPEETPLLEESDLLRILDMVVRSVRFYSKRGMNVTLDRPEEQIPHVKVRSHYLLRSLFLIFVELIESALESDVDPNIHFKLNAENDLVTLLITVTAGPIRLPTVLLTQLEKGGTLAIHVTQAGGRLAHNLDHKGDLMISITLPEAKAPDKQESLSSVPPSRRGTILIVDDEGAVIRSLRRILQIDHDVLAASSGEEALKIIQSNREIDIILYDISIPRLGAPEFSEALKRIHYQSSERVVFVSGGSTDADTSLFLQETPNHVIEKPFDLPELNELIATMLK